MFCVTTTAITITAAAAAAITIPQATDAISYPSACHKLQPSYKHCCVLEPTTTTATTTTEPTTTTTTGEGVKYLIVLREEYTTRIQEW